MAAALPELRRPIILQGDLSQLPKLVEARESNLRFDRILGRNALGPRGDKPAIITQLKGLLRPQGRILLAEAIPRHAQRLYQLIDLNRLDPTLARKLQDAEEAIYADPDDPLVNWDAKTLARLFEEAGFRVEMEPIVRESQVRVTPALLERWFAAEGTGRPSYRQRLAQRLTEDELARVEALFRAQLLNRTLPWRSHHLLLVAR
jgi:putative ATPase